MKYARRRDANESTIIAALVAVGASVQQLDVEGAPDLLVGHHGENFLLEVKQEHGKAKAGGKRTDTGLRDSQVRWFTQWRGTRPAIVTSVDEALRAIGARRD